MTGEGIYMYVSPQVIVVSFSRYGVSNDIHFNLIMHILRIITA